MIADNTYKSIAIWFAVVCMILTAFLLIWPGVLVSTNRVFKKWISTASLEKKLNRTHDVDDELLGMRKIMGYITLLISVILILLLI